MTAPTQPEPSADRPSLPEPSQAQGPTRTFPPTGIPLWLQGGAVLALYLTDPLTWGHPLPALWFPAAGLGLALIAWFGLRGTLLVLLGLLLPVVQSVALAWLSDVPQQLATSALQLGDVLLITAQLQLAWVLYRSAGRCSRGLSDPRSVVVFVLVVVGLVPLLVAGLCTGGRWLFPEPDFPGFAAGLAAAWLSQALGLVILAPVLLVTATGWLVREGYAASEPADAADILQRGAEAERPSTGDWIETFGLAASAGILGLVLAALKARLTVDVWQLWGAPLLLIVWASMRQGMRGGTVTAGAAALLPLLLNASPASRTALLLQGNLVALCAAALLISVSTTWVRASEARYRQVVTHVPVVLYSGLIRPAREGGVGPAGKHEDRRGRAVPRAEVTLVSAACRSLLGCPPERLLGPFENWLARVHPDDREIVQAAMAQLVRSDARAPQPITCEYRLPADSEFGTESAELKGRSALSVPSSDLGKVRWLRDTLAPRFDDEGRLLGWDGVVTEITQQRVLADDLRRTTTMFHALVTNLPAGVFFVQGHAGRPILVNARARQLLGQREEPGVGLSHLAQAYRLHRPDGTPYPPEELPVFQALRHGRTTMRNDIVVHRTDGRRVPLVCWAAPVQLSGQTAPDAAVWVLEDLTALQQAEAARRESEMRLRAVIETLAEGLIVQDRKGTILDVNTAACALLERSAEELRGRSLFELDWTFLREDGSPLPLEEHPSQRVLLEGQPVRNAVIGLIPGAERGTRNSERSDSSALRAPRSEPGMVRWFVVNARPLTPGPGPRAVVVTFADITDGRLAQQVVRSSEERYRELVELLPLMLVATDTERRITYINPATTTITGYSVDDLATPEKWAAVLHPEDLPRIQELTVQTLAGKPARAEARYRTKDGIEKVGFALSQPRWQDGRVVGGVTLILDVTRERLLERELQLAQRLELIGRLCSGIAHDFKNLLGVMLGLAGVATRDLPADSPVRDTLAKITEAGEHAAHLANQLLAFGKQQRVTPGPVAVNTVVRRTLDLLRPTLPCGIELVADLDEQDPSIEVDETQLQQVLLNLCLNARDAMPPGEGGSPRAIGVQTAAVSCNNGDGFGHTPDAGRDGGPETGVSRWVRLSVQDQGQGMSETVKARLFSPFFTTKERGTGLGLTVVQHIVESYGGRIEVTSELGRGTRFDVWLPQEPPARGHSPQPDHDLGALI
jgi:PAS domain S-box-containing protein